MRYNTFTTYRRLTVVSLIATLLVSCEANQDRLKPADIGLQKGFHKTKTTLTAKMTSTEQSSIEALSSVSFTGDTIQANVISHGCTTSDDFQVTHEVVNSMCQVTVVRSKPDLCRRAPFIANIELAWTLPNDCSELPVTVANPMLVTPDSKTLIKRIK